MTQTPQPSDRQLVVYENNTANDDHGRLIAIPPDLAKGIGLPAFTVGTPVPTVGTTSGEGFYDRATGMAYVWDGATWQTVTPRAEIREWETTKAYLQKDFVVHNDVLWTCIAPAGSPIGEEPKIPSTVWNVVGSNSKFQSWNATVNYVPGDHVYINNGLYEALTSSLNKTPVWPTDTAEWKYIGNIDKPIDDWDGTVKYQEKEIVIYHHGLYKSLIDANVNNTPTKHLSDTNWEFKGYLPNPATQPQDGEGLVWSTATDSFVFSTAAGNKTASTIVRNVQQGSFALPTKPTKYWKLSGNFSTSSAGVAQFRSPMFVGQSNSAWIDASDGGSGVFTFAQGTNAEGGQNKGWNNDSEVKGAFLINNAGWSLCAKQGQWAFRESKQFRLTMEAHRAASATEEWWIIHWDVMGAMWGNSTGHVYGAYWGRAAIWDNLTSVGIKMSNYTADMFIACEYF